MQKRKLNNDLEKAKKLAEIRNSLEEKSLTAIKLHDNYLKEKREKASNLGKSALAVSKRVKEKEEMKLYRFISTQKEKYLTKPQRLANTLNKPGVTS